MTDQKLDNNIFVGPKPVMNYVTGVVTLFTKKNYGEVVIKSRGKFIQRAVDVSQLVVNTFLPDKKILDVKIGSVEHSQEDRPPVRVSFIEITVGSEKNE